MEKQRNVEAQRIIKEYKNCVVGRGKDMFDAVMNFQSNCLSPDFEPHTHYTDNDTWCAPTIQMEYDGQELNVVRFYETFNPARGKYPFRTEIVLYVKSKVLQFFDPDCLAREMENAANECQSLIDTVTVYSLGEDSVMEYATSFQLDSIRSAGNMYRSKLGEILEIQDKFIRHTCLTILLQNLQAFVKHISKPHRPSTNNMPYDAMPEFFSPQLWMEGVSEDSDDDEPPN